MPTVSPPISLTLPDLLATRRLAEYLAARARVGDVIALSGTLGAGKTTLARAFIAAYALVHGATPPDEVPSPTYTLVQEYQLAGEMICHFDLYRLEHPDDAWELGIEEAFVEAISLIEWPERLGALMPTDHLWIELITDPDVDQRTAVLTANGDWPARLADLSGND